MLEQLCSNLDSFPQYTHLVRVNVATSESSEVRVSTQCSKQITDSVCSSSHA